MRTLFLITAFFIGAISFAQQISFETLSYDFGKIKEEEGQKQCVFNFKNVEKGDLIISKVKTSCGCTSSDYTKEAIKKGKAGEISVIYDPTNRPGKFSKTITVTSNSVKDSIVVLRITGEVIPRPKSKDEMYSLRLGVLKSMSDRFNLDKVSDSKISSDTLAVYNPTDSAITVSFSKVPEHISIVSEPETIAAGQEAKIILKYDAAKKGDYGFMRDRVFIVFNGVEDMKNRIYISANIFEDFSSWTPEQLANAARITIEKTVFEFDTIQQGESVSNVFSFKNTGKSDLIIRKTKTSCGCTASKPAKDTIAPGDSSEINVTFNSRGKRGRQNKSITIYCNDPNNSQTNIYIRGFVNVVEPKQE